MNVLIIEDEESAFENLKQILFEIDQSINIVAWLQSVEQSIAWFKSNSSPDLIFLDIQLSDDLSFKIFEAVQVSCPIIFTTAFDEFAIKAFELNSIDYILKPISRNLVNKALTKYRSSSLAVRNPYDKLVQDLKKITAQGCFKERFLVNKRDELIIISTSDISYFYIENSTKLVLKNGDSYPIKHSLEELIELVDPLRFYRINRQIIVSVEAITKITQWFNGKLKLQLTPTFESTVFVSREKATDFKNWIDI